MKFEWYIIEKKMNIYHSRNLLMKFENYNTSTWYDIYHSRNLLMKFEQKITDMQHSSTTVEIY